MLNTLVKRVLISATRAANGVELADGRQVFAKWETILSAGALRTPQILMLSGFGDPEEIEKHGIEYLLHSPDVGKNLWDHLGLFLP